MSMLPDEIWRRILEMGIENLKLSYKDLCCISISSRRLNRLSNEAELWSNLLTLDFPQSTIPNHSLSLSQSLQSCALKSWYKSRFEKDKERKLAARRRSVLRMESQIFVHSRSLKDLQSRLMEETDRLNSTFAELSNLENARRASVALNVWQPDIIRGRQKQIVEQCVVPVESRIRSLQMEFKLCKQQIAVLDKSYRDEKKRLDAAKEQLESMKYHPLRDFTVDVVKSNEHNSHRKKLKRCNETIQVHLKLAP